MKRKWGFFRGTADVSQSARRRDAHSSRGRILELQARRDDPQGAGGKKLNARRPLRFPVGFARGRSPRKMVPWDLDRLESGIPLDTPAGKFSAAALGCSTPRRERSWHATINSACKESTAASKARPVRMSCKGDGGSGGAAFAGDPGASSKSSARSLSSASMSLVISWQGRPGTPLDLS